MHNEQYLPPPHMCWAEYRSSEMFLPAKGITKNKSAFIFSWWVQAQRKEAFWAQSLCATKYHLLQFYKTVYNRSAPTATAFHKRKANFHSAMRFSDQCSVLWVIHKTSIKNSVRSWEKSEIIVKIPLIGLQSVLQNEALTGPNILECFVSCRISQLFWKPCTALWNDDLKG